MLFLFNKLPLILLLVLNFTFPISTLSQQQNYCGNIKLQAHHASQLNDIILCKSNVLYFRTTIGLFQISSINYTTKHLIISHKLNSPTSKFVPPQLLTAGFPSPATPNSLILFNCSTNLSSSTLLFKPCNNDDDINNVNNNNKRGSCFLIDDELAGSLFDPEMIMKCTHYGRVYKSDKNNKYEVGTRLSFDYDHVPVPNNPCDQCQKRNGNCGVGLRCVCHPKLCRDKVISFGAFLKPCTGNVLLISYMVFFSIVMNFF